MERLHYSIMDPMSIPVDYFDLNLETLRMDHERDQVCQVELLTLLFISEVSGDIFFGL